MSSEAKVKGIEPPLAIPGGEVAVEGENFNVGFGEDFRCLFNGEEATLSARSSNRLLAIVPENVDGQVSVCVETDGKRSNEEALTVGRRLAGDMHIVMNPAFDPGDGSLVLTRSGGRGQRLPATLFRLGADGYLDEIPANVLNPTGVAFANSGNLFVTNRADGSVLRVSKDGSVVPVATGLGVATGLVFDRNSVMYVGDRAGTIYRVRNVEDVEIFSILEPSVAAYHLALGPQDGLLYMTAPGLSSFDDVIRLDESGEPEVYYHGLGRPQGLAFDRAGNLYVAACLRGMRGIVKIAAEGRDAELFLAGGNVVGLCFSKDGDLIVATNGAVYSLPLGIYGTLL
jgi:sugar lactone lactonase YvrE